MRHSEQTNQINAKSIVSTTPNITRDSAFIPSARTLADCRRHTHTNTHCKLMSKSNTFRALFKSSGSAHILLLEVDDNLSVLSMSVTFYCAHKNQQISRMPPLHSCRSKQISFVLLYVLYHIQALFAVCGDSLFENSVSRHLINSESSLDKSIRNAFFFNRFRVSMCARVSVYARPHTNTMLWICFIVTIRACVIICVILVCRTAFRGQIVDALAGGYLFVGMRRGHWPVP